jgi:hypothetical protein
MQEDRTTSLWFRNRERVEKEQDATSVQFLYSITVVVESVLGAGIETKPLHHTLDSIISNFRIQHWSDGVKRCDSNKVLYLLRQYTIINVHDASEKSE